MTPTDSAPLDIHLRYPPKIFTCDIHLQYPPKISTRPNDSASTDLFASLSNTNNNTTPPPLQNRMGIVDPQIKRDQARLLLVSLLETFCIMHSAVDPTMTNSQRLFTLLCQQLSNMGVISEADFHDAFSNVRGAYSRAFRELVTQALRVVKKEQGHLVDDTILPDFTPQQMTSSLTIRGDINFLHYSSPLDIHSSTKNSPLNTLSSTLLDSSPTLMFDILDFHSTRYRTDFVEVTKLGKGGFGSVWRVRHRLDDLDYAAKKIRIKQGDKPERILREVKVLARLDHPNIVRYYSAWVENDVRVASSRKSMKSGKRTPDSLDQYIEPSEPIQVDFVDSPAISPSSTSSDDDDDDNEEEKEKDDKESNDKDNSHTYSKATDTTKFIITDKRINERSLPIDRRPLTVFIQMQLCQSTLYDFLSHRNGDYSTVNPIDNYFILRDLFRAVTYIHTKGITHRDITPRNCFLFSGHFHRFDRPRIQQTSVDSNTTISSDTPILTTSPFLKWLGVSQYDEVVVKLGDFGLVSDIDQNAMDEQQQIQSRMRIPSPVSAHTHMTFITGLNTSQTNDSRLTSITTPNNISKTHHPSYTPGLGTTTYSAPEQLRSIGSDPMNVGAHYVQQSFMSDIYSLGVIVFELFHRFTTEMERAHVLRQLRQGMLPPEFIESYPREAALVLWMMAADPTQRPTASGLLQIINESILSETAVVLRPIISDNGTTLCDPNLVPISTESLISSPIPRHTLETPVDVCEMNEVISTNVYSLQIHSTDLEEQVQRLTLLVKQQAIQIRQQELEIIRLRELVGGLSVTEHVAH